MLRFGLVAFPVQAFNAQEREQGRVHFHQLHKTCHSRIRYDKVCPIHGHVDNDEIVLGYEYQRGQYVEVDPDELDQLRTEQERALTIDVFIAPEKIDPIYFDGRMYYLGPQGDSAKEAYAVFLKALEHRGQYGVGQVVFSGRQQVVLVRPYDGVLQMAMLNYAAEINDPSVAAVGRLPASASDRKVKLAEQLIASWSEEDFDFSRYVDRYEEDVMRLIEAKVAGEELVAPEEEQEPEVYSLMDALRKSVARGGEASHGRRRAASNGHGGNGRRRSRRRKTSSHRRAS
jgi:DNA end-binding protein Ku